MFPRYLASLEKAALSDKLVILKKKWIEELSKRYPKLKSDKDKEIVWGLLETADTTKNKQYLQWILVKGISGWTNKTLSLFKEDIYKITENLELFELAKKKNKLKVEHMDIGRVKSNEALWILLQEYNSDEMKSNKDKKNEMEQSFYDKKAAILHVDTPSLKIVTPKTKEASCYFGVNTQWCTAAKQNNAFSQYNISGSLYIILDKASNKRWQFYLNTRLKKELRIEFMDEQDENIGLHDLPPSIKADTTLFIEYTIADFLKGKKLNDKLGLNDFIEIIGNPVTQKLYSALFNSYAVTTFTLETLKLFGDNPEYFSKVKPSKKVLYKAVYTYVNRYYSIEAYSKFISTLPKTIRDIDSILPIPEGLTVEQEKDLVKANPIMAFFLKNASKEDKLKAINTVNFSMAYNISDKVIENLNKDFFKDLNVASLKITDYFFNLAFYMADPDILIKLMLNNEDYSFQIFQLLTSKRPIKSKFYKSKLELFLSKHKENLNDFDKIDLVSQRGINEFTRVLEKKNLLPKKLKSNKAIVNYSEEIGYDDLESFYEVSNWFGGSKLDMLRSYSEWFEYAINRNSSKNNPMLYDVELFNGMLEMSGKLSFSSYNWINLTKNHFNIIDTSNTKIVKKLTQAIEDTLKDWLSDDYSTSELKVIKNFLDNIRSSSKTAIVFKNTVRDLSINTQMHTKYLEKDLEIIRKQAKILGIGVNIEHKLKNPNYYDVTVRISEKVS